MPIECKICGLKSTADLNTAAKHGAQWAGFVIYEPSPRHLPPAAAADLINAAATADINSVAVLVDPDDAQIDALLQKCRPSALQLSGRETTERVADIKKRHAPQIFKTFYVGDKDDFPSARAYAAVADRLLLEAPPPPGGLPGGNALPLDWRLLRDLALAAPWFLAGGLNAGNLAEAVAVSGANAVDVSSGVETARGVKSPERIRDFLLAAAEISQSAP
ncbi:MAG: phosphoribosylanthranilate isomerase [Alphaproteobacteria bacterium]|nr:phosphoribosylanthranilate isomerase [Alphaproteobacteria bacterium]MDA8004056.1 phosphoribosylanthranilate isomerase [Alphaproteobacteria bacterium]MDA8005708.1 phosphoribosylanthranilate isomerase [Alphaproteobacteria bacterium]MDA8013061.1 phosphoribosylanthranilate isomerase [Alphaproteobacteria bacterium]